MPMNGTHMQGQFDFEARREEPLEPGDAAREMDEAERMELLVDPRDPGTSQWSAEGLSLRRPPSRSAAPGP
jgi:hypothetical protein